MIPKVNMRVSFEKLGDQDEAVVMLREWAVVCRPDPFLDLPETSARCLSGLPQGHPTKDDGRRIRTSRIEEVAGRFVRTESGTLYGPPCKEYADYLKAGGYELDPEHPVKMVKEYSPAAKRLMEHG